MKNTRSILSKPVSLLATLLALFVAPGLDAQQVGPSPCQISPLEISCLSNSVEMCTYKLIFEIEGPGQLKIKTDPGPVTPSSFSLISGANPISATFSAPCGTSVDFTASLDNGKKSCLSKLSLSTPKCQCSAEIRAQKPKLCAGESTTVSLLGTPGPATWYYATGPNCPGQPPPSSSWTLLGGGTSWNTLVLDETTCYQALVNGVPGCPDEVPSNVVKIEVAPKSDAGQITCTLAGGGPLCPSELCGPAVVELSAQGANCPFRWQDGSTGSTLGPLSLTSSTCPSTSYQYQVESTCDPCPPAGAATGLTVFKPSEGGVLSAAKNPICEGDDNVLRLGDLCGDDLQWEISDNTCNNWNDIIGASGATTWFTNRLFVDSCYRVQVANGPCDEASSNPVLVNVIPKPSVLVSVSGPITFCAPGSVTLTATGFPSYPPPVSPTVPYQWFHNGLPAGSGPTLVASASGNYWVVYSTGCGSVRSQLVEVRAIKVLAAIAGACGVCPPDCIALEAVVAGGDNPYSYNWSYSGVPGPIPGQTFSACPTVPTTYNLWVKDANGCVATATHEVDICEKFEVDAGADRPICMFSSTTLGGVPTVTGGGVGPYTYNWSPATGLSSTTVNNPLAVGVNPTTYTLTVTDAQGCQASDTVKVGIKLCSPWAILFKSGLLRGEDDPVNRALERARLALAGSDLQPKIEEWYARLNERDWVTPILENPQHRIQAELLLDAGRGLIEEGQELSRLHLPLIRMAFRILEREGAPAPEGLIAEVMHRLDAAVGKPWPEVLEILADGGTTGPRRPRRNP